MKHRYYLLAAGLLAGAFTQSCGDSTPPAETPQSTPTPEIVESPRVLEPGLDALVKSKLANQSWEFQGLLTDAYQTQGYSPIWHHNSELSVQGQSLLAALLDAAPVHGLMLDLKLEKIRELRAQQSRQAEAEVDILLSEGALRFAQAMKYSNPVWEGSLEADFLAVAKSPAGIHQFLADLPPHFEDYERLTHSLRKYQHFVDQGGWPELATEIQGLKASGPLVPALKERLRAEGFWDNESSEAFGPKLRSAILEYQQTHQLVEAGWITDETFRSLNISAETRRDQIRLSLQRWRESPIGPNDTYIFVNIPDFHAEVWIDGDKQSRFKVVTGSTRTQWNAEREEHVMISATPRISSTLEHVVFNPFWNVPNSIRTREIEPKMAEDPEYADKMGFEIALDGTREYLRQRPGPLNALGQVKFMFANDHDVYLHDTPDKEFFNYPIRAFSHGCVRVDQPMDLARLLVEERSPWPVSKIDEWMAKPEETWVRLTKPVPIHIDYIVVRADEDGRTHFFADIYKLDRERLSSCANGPCPIEAD